MLFSSTCVEDLVCIQHSSATESILCLSCAYHHARPSPSPQLPPAALSSPPHSPPFNGYSCPRPFPRSFNIPKMSHRPCFRVLPFNLPAYERLQNDSRRPIHPPRPAYTDEPSHRPERRPIEHPRRRPRPPRRYRRHRKLPT